MFIANECLNGIMNGNRCSIEIDYKSIAKRKDCFDFIDHASLSALSGPAAKKSESSNGKPRRKRKIKRRPALEPLWVADNDIISEAIVFNLLFPLALGKGHWPCKGQCHFGRRPKSPFFIVFNDKKWRAEDPFR